MAEVAIKLMTEFGPHLASETVVLTALFFKVTVPVLLVFPIRRLLSRNATRFAQPGSVVSRLIPGLAF